MLILLSSITNLIGKLKFLDATTFDPFQMIDRLVNGFMQSKTGLDIVKGTFQENLQTFASLDFVIDALDKTIFIFITLTGCG